MRCWGFVRIGFVRRRCAACLSPRGASRQGWAARSLFVACTRACLFRHADLLVLLVLLVTRVLVPVLLVPVLLVLVVLVGTLSFFATTETVVSTQRHRGSVPTNVTDFSSTTVKVSRS